MLIVIGIALMMTGCATVNDDGTLTPFGEILEWTQDWHSPVEEKE